MGCHCLLRNNAINEIKNILEGTNRRITEAEGRISEVEDRIDIYRTFHPKIMNFTFLSSEHGTFSRIDHILGHKSILGKFKTIEVIPSIFSDHNAVRLDVNYRRKTIKNSNIWKLNNMLCLNNQQTQKKLKKNQNMHRNK